MRKLTVLSAIALTLSACGGGASSSNVEAYADGFCGAISKWLDVTREGVAVAGEVDYHQRVGNFPRAKKLFVEHLENVRDAAVRLRNDVSILPRPDFEGGAAAVKSMDEVTGKMVASWSQAAANAEQFIVPTPERFDQSWREFGTTLNITEQEDWTSLWRAAVSSPEFQEALKESDACQEVARLAEQAPEE